MKTSTFSMGLWIVSLVLGTAFPQSRNINDYAQLAPFVGVQWDGWQPQVRVGTQWYELVSLNGIPSDEIVAFCRERYRTLAKKRFGEDLVAVLSEMGSPPPYEVTLVLKDLDSQDITTKQCKMTSMIYSALPESVGKGGQRQHRVEIDKPIWRCHQNEDIASL